jgi:hypothetical protein
MPTRWPWREMAIEPSSVRVTIERTDGARGDLFTLPGSA